jgi:hypothetical protein
MERFFLSQSFVPLRPVASGYSEQAVAVLPQRLFCPFFAGDLVVSIQKVCQNCAIKFWHMCEMIVMAKKPVNKSAVVRDYLAKYPEKGPTAIAEQIATERGVKLTGKFDATVKTKLKQQAGAARATATATPASLAPAKRKPTRASVKATLSKPAAAPASAAGLSQHIANLKAAAQRLGKDEAKRIIDLF